VAELERELFGLEAWSPAQVREELLGKRRRAWVAGEPVHGYVVSVLTGDAADLQRIGVHPDHRRHGVASAMVDQVVGAAAEDGAVRVLLEVAGDNVGALQFYASAGFSEIARRRGYYRGGRDALVLSRPLRT